MSKQEIKDALVSVLCGPEGRVCIEGSDEDRAILQRAIESLDDCIVIEKADVRPIFGDPKYLENCDTDEINQFVLNIVNEAMKGDEG